MNEIAGTAALDAHKNPFTETVLEEVDIEQLRQEYALGYYPKNKTGHGLVREIKVAVAGPDLVVRARKSYRY